MLKLKRPSKTIEQILNFNEEVYEFTTTIISF